MNAYVVDSTISRPSDSVFHTSVRPRNEVTLSQCACTDCWGCALQHCALFSVRQFLEDESACQVLGSEKVLPMQVRVRVKNGRCCLTECRDSVHNTLVLLVCALRRMQNFTAAA